MTHAGLVKQEVLQSTFRASAGPRPLTQVEVGAFGCLKGCVEIAESTFNLSQTHGRGADIKKKIEALSEVKLESFYLQPRKVDARVLLSNPASHQQLIFDLLLLLLSFIRRTQLIITADPTHRRWRTLLSSSTSVHLDQCNEKISNLLHNKDLNPNKDTKKKFLKKEEIFRFCFFNLCPEALARTAHERLMWLLGMNIENDAFLLMPNRGRLFYLLLT